MRALRLGSALSCCLAAGVAGAALPMRAPVPAPAAAADTAPAK
jgi:hypothetical protein